jgi:hypothetical protein
VSIRNTTAIKTNLKPSTLNQTHKMKKTLLTLALVALTTVASYAQGTIAFGNSALTRVTVQGRAPDAGQTSGFGRATAADGLNFYVFFGAAGATDPSALTQVQQAAPLATIGATPGVMVNAPSVFALPGTEAGQVVSLQIRAWNADRTLTGETRIAQVTLAPTAGPGAVIWQSSDTNPNRFTPLIIVPEPSTIALAVLGLGSLLLFRRRK